MVRVAEIVGDAVEDHVASVDAVDAESLVGAGWAHGLGEAEGEVADRGADTEYDADQAHLLAPGSLLGLGRHSEAAQHRVGTPERDEAAVGDPWAQGRDGGALASAAQALVGVFLVVALLELAALLLTKVGSIACAG